MSKTWLFQATNFWRAAVFSSVTIAFAASAFAQVGPVLDQPLLESTTKSYFELVTVKTEEIGLSSRHAQEVRWEVAEKLASKRTHQGRRGRLAVIRSPEVYLFLLREFRSDHPAWIGLRYICRDRQLQWSSGQKFRKGDFQAWHHQWDQSVRGAGCRGTQGGERPFMPVAVSPAMDGFKWFAVGGFKEYTRYFVEYPADDQ